MARRAEDDTYAEHPKGVAEGGVARRDTRLDFTAPQVACEEGTLAQLVEEFVDSSERPAGVQDQMESTCMYDGGYNELDKFRDGRTELLCYSITRVCDLLANRNQDFLALFSEPQRCGMIRLERSAVSTSTVANGVPSYSP